MAEQWLEITNGEFKAMLDSKSSTTSTLNHGAKSTKRKYLTVAELEIQRQASLALFVSKSITDSAKECWMRTCRSDATVKLSATSRRGLRLRPEDRTRVGRMIVPERIGTGSRALDAASKMGVRKPKDGIVYPKAGCRSIKVVRRSELLNAGMPEELVIQVMKAQADRIRIKQGSTLVRLANLAGMSLKEASEIKLADKVELA